MVEKKRERGRKKTIRSEHYGSLQEVAVSAGNYILSYLTSITSFITLANIEKETKKKKKTPSVSFTVLSVLSHCKTYFIFKKDEKNIVNNCCGKCTCFFFFFFVFFQPPQSSLFFQQNCTSRTSH